MTGDVDPCNILFTLLGGALSKGKELSLQDMNGVRDTLAAEIDIPLKTFDPLLVKFGILKRKSSTEPTKLQVNRLGLASFHDKTPQLPILINWQHLLQDKSV